MLINERFSIRIVESGIHKYKILFNHPSFEHIGELEVTILSKCPECQPEYPEDRRSIPVIWLSKGLLCNTECVSFNSYWYMNKIYYDIMLIFDTSEREVASFDFTKMKMTYSGGESQNFKTIDLKELFV